MIKKLLIAILLFYAAILLQKSFFSYFSLFGAVPDLVFVVFFVVCFLSAGVPSGSGQASGWKCALYGISAGFFLDVFSFTIIGPSMVLLGILGIILARIKRNLSNNQEKIPLVNFSVFFLIFLAVYKFIIAFYIPDIFNANAVLTVIYDSVLALAMFLIYKKLFNEKLPRKKFIF